ncbi:MAG TPA: hypothetical protein VN688_09645 [Gemmataceae bacterium]|nr:hypothetical protein [Gemmataceae bacterium]
MPEEDQQIQSHLPAASQHVLTSWPITCSGIRFQSAGEMWRAVGRILWTFAEIYMAAFAGILMGFFVGVAAAIVLLCFNCFGLALLMPGFTMVAGGLLFAFLAWKDRVCTQPVGQAGKPDLREESEED